jgi:hypothetical protein
MRGRRQRTLINAEEGKIILMIRRLFCPECNCIHHELPDCIVPYKRHSVNTIAGIINGDTAVPCEDKTIVRTLAWWALVQTIFMCVLTNRTQEQHTFPYELPVFKKIIGIVVNSNGWISANSVCTRSAVNSGQV